VPGADRAHHQGGGEIGAEHGVDQPVGKGRIEDHRQPVDRHELAAGIHRKAGRRVHPAVGRQDPESRDEGADRDRQGGHEVQRAADAVHAEQHDAQEAGLEEEGGQHLVGHHRPDDGACLVGEGRPVGAELIGHDDARDHAHAEGQRKDFQPVLEQVEIDLTPRPQP